MTKPSPVSLKRPASSSDKGQPETVSLWVVDVREIDGACDGPRRKHQSAGHRCR